MTMCSSMTRGGTIHVRVGRRPLAMAVASVPRRAGGSFRASTLHGRWTCDWFVSPATWRRSWSARDRRSTRFRTAHGWLARGCMGEKHLLNHTFLREEDLRTMRCSHRSFILQPQGKLWMEWRYFDRVPTRMVGSRPSPRKPSIHCDVTGLHRFLPPFLCAFRLSPAPLSDRPIGKRLASPPVPVEALSPGRPPGRRWRGDTRFSDGSTPP